MARSACLLSALMAMACSSDDNAGPGSGTAGASLDAAGGTGGAARADATDGKGGGDSADGGLDAFGMGGTGGAGGMGGTDIVDAGGERGFDTDDGSFPPDAAVGSCAPVNWTVSASASAPADPPLNAIDGALGTRWSTGGAQALGQYYEIDFGGYVQLSQITLNSSGSIGDYPHGYEVAVSNDDIDFSRVITAASVDLPPVNDILTIDFPLHSARFLRINQTGFAGNWWSIHELTTNCRVPGPPDPLACNPDGGVRDAGTIDPFARANWTATASLPEGGLPEGSVGTPPSNAFDGDLTTRWTSGAPQVGNEVFKLDLGSVGCIGQVFITTTGGDAANAYRLEISVDDVAYTAVARGAGQAVMQIVFAPHLARYIRILQTGTTVANYWSINEIAVRP